MQLHLICMLIQLYLTVSGSKDLRVHDNGATEMPHKRISFKAVEKPILDSHVPMKNESWMDNLPKHEKDKSILRHKDWDVEHIIYKFNTQCQTDVNTMDSYCSQLLVKLRNRMKIKLDLPDLQQRQMTSEVMKMCFSARPPDFVWYNPSQDVCCDGRIHQKVTGNEMCCRTKRLRGIYDSTQYLCCNGIIYNRTTPYQACCGTHVYDTRSTSACCNDNLYDPRHKFCCGGRTLHHNIGRRNKNGRCCGVEWFDNRCYLCTKDTQIRPIFNPQLQRCCHGRIKNVEDDKDVCCGKQLIDASIQQCIENTVVRRKQSKSLHVLNTKGKTLLKRLDEETSKVVTPKHYTDETFKVATPLNTPSTQWTVGSISITVLGVLVIGLVVYLCKRRKHQKRSLDVSDIAFNKETESILELTRPTTEPISYVSWESGYQSSTSFRREQSFDDNDNKAKTNQSPANELIAVAEAFEEAVEEAVKDLIDIQEDRGLFEDGIPKVSTRYEKKLANEDTNLTSELFSDAETQTVKSKESNLRDVFGNVYQHSQYLDKFNRTVQWDKSDSKMTLPASAITLHKLYVQASSFDNIPAIFKKFRLTADDRLASPVVEYCFTGCKSLTEHALLELPILKGNTEVYKFHSDGGIYQHVELESIRVLEEEDYSFDTFCIIKREKVLIYTKMFSGFLCLNHGLRQNFSLNAFLFASYKKVMQNPEVRLSLYIADELHDLRDYNQRMFNKEHREGKEIHAEEPLDLPECLGGGHLDGNDYLEITAVVQSEVADLWEHKLHPRENRPIKKELKVVKMNNLTRCCQSENSLPHQVAWYLINKSRVTPSPVVQVVVDITCKLSDQRAESSLTTLVIDELKIRESDRTEVLSDCQRVAGLKQFLTQYTEPVKREAILTKLTEYVRRLDPTVPPSDNLMDILNTMEKDLHPVDFMSAVANILRQIKAFDLLDILVYNKLIPVHLLQKPVQPQQHNIENRPQATGGAPNIQPPISFPFGTEASASDNVSQGVCRPEIETTNTCSFDNNNESAVGQNEQVVRPRPELPNTTNEFQRSDLQHVGDGMLQPDTSSADIYFETEPITLYVRKT